MEIKEIINKGKKYFLDMFSDRIHENLVLLEEIEPLDNGKWKITLSFYEKRVATSTFATMALLGSDLVKTYKVLFLDKDGRVEKVKNYD